MMFVPDARKIGARAEAGRILDLKELHGFICLQELNTSSDWTHPET
jgi:hypothetical protein